MSAPMLHEYVSELAVYAILFLFTFGAFTVLLILGDWAYRAFKKWRRPRF